MLYFMLHMTSLAAVIIFFLFGPIILSGQLHDAIISIVEEEESEYALFGISVINQKGQEVYGLNQHGRFMPASTLKTITTLSGLAILGREYRFRTKVFYSGEIAEDGTLYGDIYVEGSGDPTLGSIEYHTAGAAEDVFEEIHESLLTIGIQCIDGALVIVSQEEEKRIHPSWAWDDLTNYYASGASSLNFHENLYYVEFERSTRPGELTKIANLYPDVPGLSIRNKVTTGAKGSGDNAYIYGDPYASIRWIEGTIPPGTSSFRIKGAVPDPRFYFAHNLAKYLRQRNLYLSDYRLGTSPSRKNSVATIFSDELYDIARYANHKSNNMYCESIYQTAGIENSGARSFDSGHEAISTYLSELDLPRDELILEDGSGLSWRNRVSPYFLSSFLHSESVRNGFAYLKGLLPKVGKEGSVRSFMQESAAAQELWLKSGSINHVLCYTGIIRASSGEYFLITLMANGHNSNRKLRLQHKKIIEVIYHSL